MDLVIELNIFSSVRLVGGTSAANGRVEVNHNGVWGTVCDDSFDIEDANMICRSLGYSGAADAQCCAAYGQGTDPILLDDLNCPSGAANLDACSGWSWGQHNCAHSEDASVVCTDTDGGAEGTCKYFSC